MGMVREADSLCCASGVSDVSVVVSCCLLNKLKLTGVELRDSTGIVSRIARIGNEYGRVVCLPA